MFRKEYCTYEQWYECIYTGKRFDYKEDAPSWQHPYLKHCVDINNSVTHEFTVRELGVGIDQHFYPRSDMWVDGQWKCAIDYGYKYRIMYNTDDTYMYKYTKTLEEAEELIDIISNITCWGEMCSWLFEYFEID